MSSWPELGNGWSLRLAEPSDNAAILDYLSRQTMRAEVQLRFDRSPDFFALPRLHGATTETWLAVHEGRIRGMGSLVVKRAYINGGAENVAYLSDLRIDGSRQLAGRWFDVLMARARHHDVRYGYASLLADNAIARRAISRHPEVFSSLCRYWNVSIIARKPGCRTAVNPVVHRAGRPDCEALRRYLDSQARREVFGPVLDEVNWRNRLQAWPNLAIDDFLLVRDEDGEISGTLAPWDCRILRATVIDALPGSTEWVRRAANAIGYVLGRSKIPKPGSGVPLPEIYLSHLAVTRRDPRSFQALLDGAYADVMATGRYALMTFCLYDSDPLWAALDRYWHTKVSLELLAFRTSPAFPELTVGPSGTTGFEIYLV